MSDILFERVPLPVVDQAQLALFEELVAHDRRWRRAFHHQHPYDISDTQLVVYAAKDGEKIIGVGLGALLTHLKSADIFHIGVSALYRKRGIGRQLLKVLCEAFTQQKAHTVSLRYLTGEPETAAIEHVLETEGWDKPEEIVIRTTYDRYSFNPAWLESAPKLPEGFQIFFWKDLQSEERALLKHQESQGVFPFAVSPLRDEDMIEYSNSLGIRHQGEVIGWMVTHRISADTIRYSAIFVQKKYRSLGLPIRLGNEATKLHVKSLVMHAVMDINIQASKGAWLKFMKARMFPYATSMKYIMHTSKSL